MSRMRERFSGDSDFPVSFKSALRDYIFVSVSDFNRFLKHSLRKLPIKSKDFDYITVSILGLEDRHGSSLNLTTDEYHNLNCTVNMAIPLLKKQNTHRVTF